MKMMSRFAPVMDGEAFVCCLTHVRNGSTGSYAIRRLYYRDDRLYVLMSKANFVQIRYEYVPACKEFKTSRDDMYVVDWDKSAHIVTRKLSGLLTLCYSEAGE